MGGEKGAACPLPLVAVLDRLAEPDQGDAAVGQDVLDPGLRDEQRGARVATQVPCVLREVADQEDRVTGGEGEGHQRAERVAGGLPREGTEGPARRACDECPRTFRLGRGRCFRLGRGGRGQGARVALR